MRIGGFQKFSLIDYPGKVAAIIFTQGCNFRCPYCHNSALVLPEKFQPPIPEDMVLSFLYKRQGTLEGVVVSGGEPSIQGDLLPFLRKIRRMSYSIKLDTNGSRPDVLEKIFQEHLVDYVAMDIKAPLDRYEKTIGVPIQTDLIHKSIQLILHSGIDHEFRTTVVKTLCPPEAMADIADLIPGAQKYTLQAFVPGKTVLDPALLRQTQYSPEEFSDLKSRWEILPAASLTR